MHETIYKICVENFNDDEIAAYYYTDYDKANKDALKMVKNRNKLSGIDYFRQVIHHYDEVATIVYQFDDDISVSVEQCGWAQDDGGNIRAIFGVDYTGRTNYKIFHSSEGFHSYIKDTQPVFKT